jgi:hypothetical protein
MGARAMAAAVGMLWAGDAPTAPTEPPPLSYQVQVGPDAEVLQVEVTFPAGAAGPLVVADGGERFVRDVSVEAAGRWSPVPHSPEGFVLPGCTTGCRARYHFLLREAAAGFENPETAASFGGAFIAPLSTWLLHPAEAGRGGYQLMVHAGNGDRFSCGLPRALEPDSYRVTNAGLRVTPMCVFGRWRIRTLQQGASHLTVAIAPVRLEMSDVQIEAWVRQAADAVAAYYHRFPVAELLVVVAPSPGQRLSGVTMGEGGASVLLRLGTVMPAARAQNDWVLTHELMHLGFPSMDHRHLWMEEGMAVFAEPVVRVRAGMADQDMLWSEWLEQGPLGLPKPGDGGLEETHTWARTYWGGALFWLLADVTLRERTGNNRSVDDILRALVDAGGNVTRHWDMEEVLRIADATVGLPVFSEQYRQLAEKPGAPDLPGLWRRLGVSLDHGRVVYDDTAPLAHLRRAMTKRSAAR